MRAAGHTPSLKERLFAEELRHPRTKEEYALRNIPGRALSLGAWSHGDLLLVEKEKQEPQILASIVRSRARTVIPYAHDLNQKVIAPYLAGDTHALERHDTEIRRRRQLIDQYFGVVHSERDLRALLEAARETGHDLLAAGPTLEELPLLRQKYTQNSDWAPDREEHARYLLGEALGGLSAQLARERFGEGGVAAILCKYSLPQFVHAYTGKSLDDLLPVPE